MAVVIETTLGDITVDLFIEERPQTCKNFLKLCKVKYYNFCLFHTIQPNFIAQTGDPTGIGNGGESVFGLVYGEESKYYEAEKMPKIKHSKPGLLSMVNYGNNMLGSQFFVTLGTELKSLEEHCVFAEVTEGHDILIKLNDAICDSQHRPYQDIRITHTVILEDPFDDLPGLLIPDASPDLSSIQASNGRIGADEKINDEEGLSEVQLQEIKADREAKARATILEIVGDLPHADVAPPENVLFVCKLNPVTTDEDLEILFGRFGKVKSCEVIRDHQTGDSLQYAFVEFEDQKSCEQAYLKMDNVLIDDRRIHVDFSQSVSKIKWRGKGLGVQYIEKPEEKDNSRSVDRHGSSKKDYYRDRERDRDRDRNDRRRDDDRRRRTDRDADDYRRRERRKGDDSRRRDDDNWRDRGEEDRYDEDRKRRELREERRREEERKYSSRREERSRRDEDRRRDGDKDKRRNGTDKKDSTTSSSRRGEHHNDDRKNEKAESSKSKEVHEAKEESKHDSSRQNKERVDKIDSKTKDLASSSNSHSKVKEEVVQKEEIEPKNNSEEAQPKVVVETDRSLLDSSVENMTPEKGSTSAIKDKKKKKRKPSTSSESTSSNSDDSSSSSSSLDQRRKRKHNVTVAKKYYHRGKLVKIIKKKKNDSSDSESSEESSDSDRKRRKTKYKKIVKVIKKRRRTSTDDSDSDTSSSEDTDSSRPRKKKRKNDKNLKKKKKESKKKKKKKNDPSESSFSEDDKLKRKGKSLDVKKQKKELSD